METEFTKAEREAINAGFRAIEYLCTCTNVGQDKPRLEAALKAERKVQDGDLLAAKAKICRAWLEGAEEPHQAVACFCHYRDSLLLALVLGARHKLERADSDYTGPLLRDAMRLAAPASQAMHDRTERRLDTLQHT